MNKTVALHVRISDILAITLCIIFVILTIVKVPMNSCVHNVNSGMDSTADILALVLPLSVKVSLKMAHAWLVDFLIL